LLLSLLSCTIQLKKKTLSLLPDARNNLIELQKISAASAQRLMNFGAVCLPAKAAAACSLSCVAGMGDASRSHGQQVQKSQGNAARAQGAFATASPL
jgi:hypothetical protein